MIASTVGTGVLASSGYMIKSLPAEQVILIWVVQAVIAILGAIAYGAVAKRVEGCIRSTKGVVAGG